MGGGRQMLLADVTGTEEDPIDKWAGRRVDGLNLISTWMEDKKSRNASYRVVKNTEQLLKVDVKVTDFLLGIFANGHLSMDYKRNKGLKGMPSLKEMTTTALKILQKEDQGYVLMV